MVFMFEKNFSQI